VQRCRSFSSSSACVTTKLLSPSIFQALADHDPKSPAIVHSASNKTFNYGNLVRDVALSSEKLLGQSGRTQLNGERIAFVAENGYDYVGAHSTRWALSISIYGLT
jgi:malonyl-CoA/methylmalonyl-CoA synthetase